MQSRLQKQLDAAIDAAGNPVKADCLRAERACLMARLGHFDDARKALTGLQQQYAVQPHMALSAWISLAEGLIAHYGKLGSAEAVDKIHRAYAMSGAAREPALHALCCAWLAHLDYVRHDFASMTRRVAETLLLADAKHHAAQSRISLVIAQTYHFAGRYERAQPWYTLTRQHATSEGDEATLAALLANMAWLNASQARQNVLSGPGEAQATRQAMLGAESSQNFDALVGTAALDALAPVMRAQLLSLQGRHADALPLYEQHLDHALTQGAAHMANWLRADLGWCRIQLKQLELAREDAQAAEAANRADCDLDDRAATHSRLAQVYAALGQLDAAKKHSQQAEAAWKAFADEQAEVLRLLDAALTRP
jgi:tetratricopeptide (TPR) repeat protein